MIVENILFTGLKVFFSAENMCNYEKTSKSISFSGLYSHFQLETNMFEETYECSYEKNNNHH